MFQHEIKNIYVGEIPEWQPGANTFMYLPMKTDFNDATGNNTMTNTGATITTVDGVTCGYFYYNMLTGSVIPSTSTNKTFSLWIRPDSWNSGFIMGCRTGGEYTGDELYYNNNGGYFDYECYTSYYDQSVISSSTSLSQNTWQHLCYSNGRLYWNGEDATTSTSGTMNIAVSEPYKIGQQSSGHNPFRGYMSELIVETVGWTSQEVSDYYNQTKANYGL